MEITFILWAVLGDKADKWLKKQIREKGVEWGII